VRQMSVMSRGYTKAWKIISPLLLVAVLWKMLSWLLVTIKGVPFPAPEDVAAEFAGYLQGTDILGHSLAAQIWATIQRWLSGFLIGSITGIAIGIVCSLSGWLSMAVYPVVLMLQMVPGLAWIPVAILMVGIGPETSVFIITLATFPPVTIGLMEGIRGVPEEYLFVSRMCGDSPLRCFFLTQLPAAFPAFMTGMRLGLANSWRVVVAAEMVVGTGVGLGYVILQSRWDMNYEAAFVCIGVIVFLGTVIERWGFSRLERYTVKRWGMLRE
jgi:ABC-type nitrate/sulfonate/bicarbonate transport system permease component